MSDLKYLMSPITVRGKTYPNRLIAAPAMGMMIHEDGVFPPGQGSERAVSIARGGWGGVYIGETPVDTVWADRFFFGYDQPMPQVAADMYTDFSDVNGPKKNSWRKIATEVHNAGSLIFSELFHAGNMRRCMGKFDERPVALGPMGYTRPDGQVVKMMDEEDMDSVCRSFAQAAVYMKDAGFDGIMVHAGHGWLLTQFLSERCNKRDDAYGGSMEKRCKFPVMVLKAIRDAVGDDFIIECRISGEETGVPGGYKVEQAGVFTEMCGGLVDIMHISNGHYNLHYSSRVSGSGMYDGHICNLEQALYVKEHAPKGMLINVVGGISDPFECDRLIGEGKLDFVSMAKQINADPEFGNKCRAGKAEDVQQCALCMYCAGGGSDPEDWELSPMPLGAPVELDDEGNDVPRGPRESFCTVNPQNGLIVPREGWPTVITAKRVLVAGGGIAGMMAATTAADRSHIVSIAEKTEKLGGRLNMMDNSIYKKDLAKYRQLLERRVAERHIPVKLGEELSAELVEEFKPDVILAAVGAVSRVPEIKGIENAVNGIETYSADLEVPENVIVVGGGMFACEIAIHLAERAKKVTVIKTGPKDGAPVPMVRKKMLETGIEYIEKSDIIEIEPNAVVCAEGRYEADRIYFFTGMEPDAAAVEAVKKAAGDVPVILIGDCSRPVDVAHAIRAAYVEAMKIC